MINTFIKISFIGFSFLITSCDIVDGQKNQRSQNNNSNQQSATGQNTKLQISSSENINSDKDIVEYGIVDYGLKPEQLPPIVRSELDKRFSGWRFPKVDESIHRYLRENNSPDTRPEFISGDFDGNGQSDYAVMIEHGAALSEDGNAVGHNIYVVAFLKNGNKLKFYKASDDGEYIAVIKKGEKGYDYATDKNFTYENDAVFSGYFEKAGSSHVYEKGKFRSITTSD